MHQSEKNIDYWVAVWIMFCSGPIPCWVPCEHPKASIVVKTIANHNQNVKHTVYMDIMWILLIGVIAIASFGQGRKNWSHNALAKNRQVWPIYRTDDQTLNAGLSFFGPFWKHGCKLYQQHPTTNMCSLGEEYGLRNKIKTSRRSLLSCLGGVLFFLVTIRPSLDGSHEKPEIQGTHHLLQWLSHWRWLLLGKQRPLLRALQYVE